jgi:putative sigma-54 modulation protein
MIINISTNGVDMTDSIREYAEDKIESVDKFFDNITKADIIVGMDSSNKAKPYFAEVNLAIPGTSNVFVRKNSEDLYKAIDKLRDHLKIELEKMKGKMRDKDKESLRNNKGYQE